MAFGYARARTDVRLATDADSGIGAGCSAAAACGPPAKWVSR